MDHELENDPLLDSCRARGLGDALRRASAPAPVDEATDRSIRAEIHAHAGFGAAAGSPRTLARGVASISQADAAKRSERRRWLCRRVLASGGLAAAAVLVLWISGIGSLLFPPIRGSMPTTAASAVGDDLAEAVRLSRRSAGDRRVPALLAAIVATASAAGDLRSAGSRFVAVDLVMLTPEGVDGLVLDLVIDDPRGVIVGIESGDAPFNEPPTYDPERLARGEIRLAAIPARTASEGVRVATISLRCDDAGPGVSVRSARAVRERGAEVVDVPVVMTVSPRSTP